MSTEFPQCRKPFQGWTRATVIGTVAMASILWAVAPAGADPPSRPWGGSECPARSDLRHIVDVAFAASPPADASGNGRGSGAPGYSVALSKDGCGTFLYAVGKRNVEDGKAMNVRVRHHLGSLTKLLSASLILRLDRLGAFGTEGIETPVDQLLSPEDLAALSLGTDASQPLCPADILAIDRSTGALAPVSAQCPDFSRITLRHLLNGNHGLFDFITEVDRNANGVLDSDELALASLFEVLGLPRQTLPEGASGSLDLLVASGVLANPNAVIGGHGLADFESSFGNTGYTLLGVIAERITGWPYQRLLRVLIGAPLRLPMRSLEAPPDPEGLIARQYLVTSGAESVGLPEDLFGAYPLTEIAGNPAVNVYELDAFAITNSAGGAGAAVMAPGAYGQFFRALLDGELLSSEAQERFDDGFITIDELPGVLHGFGVFRFEDPEFGPGYAKSGRVTGSVCQLLHFTDLTVTVVACRNSADAFLIPPSPPSATPVADLARELVRATVP